MKSKNIAVILAAGRGERSGFDIPKQLISLAGKPVVEHTILAFQNCVSIDEIIIVSSIHIVEKIEKIVFSCGFNKVKKIISGGKDRHDSSLAAINVCTDMADQFNVRLIFHDAVRPLVSERIICDVVKALDHYNAVNVVVKTTDTIISADTETNTIASVLERNLLRNSQTPQGFNLQTIKASYELALRDPEFIATDDCGVVFRYSPDEKIYLVAGDNNNIKLTYKDDLPVIETLLRLQANQMIQDKLKQ